MNWTALDCSSYKHAVKKWVCVQISLVIASVENKSDFFSFVYHMNYSGALNSPAGPNWLTACVDVDSRKPFFLTSAQKMPPFFKRTIFFANGAVVFYGKKLSSLESCSNKRKVHFLKKYNWKCLMQFLLKFEGKGYDNLKVTNQHFWGKTGSYYASIPIT